MTDEEVILIYTEMEGMFGNLPSWQHEPMQFAYLVKLYKYYKTRNLIMGV
jgi:hypothetical protein